MGIIKRGLTANTVGLLLAVIKQYSLHTRTQRQEYKLSLKAYNNMIISSVTNMRSPRTGAKVANQFIITEHGRGALGNFDIRETFQSYDRVIAIRTKWEGKVEIQLDETYWNYSRTTSKYRNEFLGETTEETKAKIKSGQYTLIALN